jgi:hypothetical protein
MIKRFFAALVLSFITVIAASPMASAAKPIASNPSTTLLGIDVSFPQCGKTLPSDHAFGIVGINDGNAAGGNPCLAEQLIWASQAKGGTNQAPLQLYINTANPGQVIHLVRTWPSSNTDSNGFTPTNPYTNTCTGSNDLSCSWMYGRNRAIAAEKEFFMPAAESAGISPVMGDYVWWLDVETMNTWQTGGADALRRNVAALEGWTSYLIQQGADVGLYSTAVQWKEITGNYISSTSNLNGLRNWRPSGSSLKNAKNNCRVAPLTSGGYISLTQFISKGLDYNYSCI